MSGADYTSENAIRHLHLFGSVAPLEGKVWIDIEAMLHNCKDPECGLCAILMCPHQDPLHFHHDGCPSRCGR